MLRVTSEDVRCIENSQKINVIALLHVLQVSICPISNLVEAMF